MEDFSTNTTEVEAAPENPAAKTTKRVWHAPCVEVLNIDATAGGAFFGTEPTTPAGPS
jgi:hypothetical protein